MDWVVWWICVWCGCWGGLFLLGNLGRVFVLVGLRIYGCDCYCVFGVLDWNVVCWGIVSVLF